MELDQSRLASEWLVQREGHQNSSENPGQCDCFPFCFRSSPGRPTPSLQSGVDWLMRRCANICVRCKFFLRSFADFSALLEAQDLGEDRSLSFFFACLLYNLCRWDTELCERIDLNLTWRLVLDLFVGSHFCSVLVPKKANPVSGPKRAILRLAKLGPAGECHHGLPNPPPTSCPFSAHLTPYWATYLHAPVRMDGTQYECHSHLPQDNVHPRGRFVNLPYIGVF